MKVDLVKKFSLCRNKWIISNGTRRLPYSDKYGGFQFAINDLRKITSKKWRQIKVIFFYCRCSSQIIVKIWHTPQTQLSVGLDTLGFEILILWFGYLNKTKLLFFAVL